MIYCWYDKKGKPTKIDIKQLYNYFLRTRHKAVQIEKFYDSLIHLVIYQQVSGMASDNFGNTEIHRSVLVPTDSTALTQLAQSLTLNILS